MPGSKKEVTNAKEEGVQFVFNVSPKSLKVENNKAIAVELLTTSMSEADETGRQKVLINQGSEYLQEADIIILALGFSPEVPKFLEELKVETNSWGGIVIDSKFRTTNTNVYAGGDCRRGAHLAVTAAYDGRSAAESIKKDLVK